MMKDTKTVFEDEWIIIKFEEQKPKTKVFSVWSKCQNLRIGDIVYDNGWRHYIFDDGQIKLSDRCLLALNQFVALQNHEKGISFNKGFSQSEVELLLKELKENLCDVKSKLFTIMEYSLNYNDYDNRINKLYDELSQSNSDINRNSSSGFDTTLVDSSKSGRDTLIIHHYTNYIDCCEYLANCGLKVLHNITIDWSLVTCPECLKYNTGVDKNG